MATLEPAPLATATALSDAEIVRRVRAGEGALFEILMRRHNRRVYRVARAVVKNEAEVEDVMQQAYINAFTHIDQFEERAQFSTWLTRIALHEAFGRRRKMRRSESLESPHPDHHDEGGAFMDSLMSPLADPEHQAYAGELHRVLEAAVDALPDTYRTVFMLRDIEGLSTSETGDSLGLGEEAVKTRLHRARGMVRGAVIARLGSAKEGAFQFHAVRCDRVVAGVMARLAAN
jgi:RNA polymerase sigma-70 factor, ECF subfamily